MNISGLIGTKIDQKQGFLEDGRRIPLSIISVSPNFISQIKTATHEGYSAVQLATGSKKKMNRAGTGHINKAGLKNTPRFFREMRLSQDDTTLVAGAELHASDVFKPGDVIDVTGVSKGKGFAGGVKRHHFRGGPRTHGQSDRERAPGSIGQTTTPGRVYKGKRMAGHMGHVQVTVKNLTVLDIVDDTLYVLGLIPGPKGTVVTLKKIKESKKFVPLFKKVSATVDAPIEEVQVESVAAVEEALQEPVKVEVEEETVKTEAVEETPVEEAEKSEALVEEEKKEETENGGK